MNGTPVEGTSGLEILLDLPRESLVAIIRQMSSQLNYLRSRLAAAERRNHLLQDSLPRVIRTTIRSAMSGEEVEEEATLDNVDMKEEEEGASAAAGVTGAVNAVPPPVGLLPLTSTVSANSLTPEPSAMIKLLNAFLQPPPTVPTGNDTTIAKDGNSLLTHQGGSISENPEENLSAEMSEIPQLTPLPPLSSFDGELEDEDDLPLAGRPRRTRTEATSLLSDEVIQQVEEQIQGSMNERRERFWQIFLESKGWTRATCALMSCLFTRWQMAHSTVYGRRSMVDGEARDRLPTRLVQYIVTKINQRFGVHPVKVRARMAQKCKDLRRLMRKYGEDAVAAEGPEETKSHLDLQPASFVSLNSVTASAASGEPFFALSNTLPPNS
uniref:BEN domain-containing protein n=1 Tax=Mesocestoides corti TaxID=53468 RepID=A0A5K3F6F1_MESCO